MRALKAVLLLLVSSFFLGSHLIYAAYSSSNYSVNEFQFGSGGDYNLSSSNYTAQSSLGGLGGGDFSSANYRSNVGFLTQNTIYLEMATTTSLVDLGTLDSTTTASGTAGFYVRTYLSQAYSVITNNAGLTQEDGYVLNNLASPSASTAGSEQFGINLVKNTNFCGSGCDLGADPANQPSNSFADGKAATNYNTGNLFKYHQGDVIAGSPKTSGNQAIGQTNYTISYIANIAALTRAGFYKMNHDITAVATY